MRQAETGLVEEPLDVVMIPNVPAGRPSAVRDLPEPVVERRVVDLEEPAFDG